MDQSLGRVTEPTTEAGGPDAPEAASTPDHPDAPTPPGVFGRVRDLPPSGRYEDTGITDLDELQRHIDPLDPRRPRRLTDDPLDPERDVR